MAVETVKTDDVLVQTSAQNNDKDHYVWISCRLTKHIIGYGQGCSQKEAVEEAYKECLRNNPAFAAKVKTALSTSKYKGD